MAENSSTDCLLYVLGQHSRAGCSVPVKGKARDRACASGCRSGRLYCKPRRPPVCICDVLGIHCGWAPPASGGSAQPCRFPAYRGAILERRFGMQCFAGGAQSKEKGCMWVPEEGCSHPDCYLFCSVAVSVTSVSCHVGLDTLLGLLSALASLG